METIRALIRGDLPPAGNKILTKQSLEFGGIEMPGYSSIWIDSGTSALALALCHAKHASPHIKRPKVLIPGYCCPDLVAAVVYAGLRPVAIDIGEYDPAYNLTILAQALDHEVVAVIAVNFLGITENLMEIKKLLIGTDIKLIEDNAQWFPSRAEEFDFQSDYIVFSFGRGKPLSLLGGGVLFVRGVLHSTADFYTEIQPAFEHLMSFKLKVTTYNLLLHPNLYVLLNRNPFFQLGKTQYDPLLEISRMSDYRKSIFDINFAAYSARSTEAQLHYQNICNELTIQKLDSACLPRCRRLLRYPLLCESKHQRDIFLQALVVSGLGATAMYRNAIDEIEGIEGELEIYGSLENSKKFAKRFLTLPIHNQVSEKVIKNIKNTLTKKRNTL